MLRALALNCRADFILYRAHHVSGIIMETAYVLTPQLLWPGCLAVSANIVELVAW